MNARLASHALWLLCIGCHRAVPPASVAAPPPVVVALPQPLSEWPTTLADAQRAAGAEQFDEADRILLRYGLKYQGTPEGAESDFWRAVFKADPSNPGPAARERIALFDAYLTAGPSAARYLEAMVFRRLLETVTATRAALADFRGGADSRQRAREDEIKKLSEDLDRAMAELDRIKKRLTPVKPPQ